MLELDETKHKPEVKINLLTRLFMSDRVMMIAIAINIIVLFILSFDDIQHHLAYLEYLDNAFTVFFFLEAIAKITHMKWKNYISSGWNRLDFAIVALTTPSLLLMFLNIPDFSLLLVLRALRVAKFFRFLKFVPNLDELMNGVGRALKASLFVLLAFFLYNVIISLFTCYLFKEVAPEYFGNALQSCYSIFKMFTLEGWYEVPEAIAKRGSVQLEFFAKFYFIFIVFTGGVFGLSIVNAIFVNEMVSDKSTGLAEKVDALQAKIDYLIQQIEANDQEEKK